MSFLRWCRRCPCAPGAPAGNAWSAGMESLGLWVPLGIGTEAKEQCPCAPGAPAGSAWSAGPTANACASRSGIARPLGIARCRSCGGIEDAIANQWVHWFDPFRGFPPVIIRLSAKNVGADALIGPPLRSLSSQGIPGRFARHFRQKTAVVRSGHRLTSAVY